MKLGKNDYYAIIIDSITTVRTVNIRAQKGRNELLNVPFFFKRVVKCPKNHGLNVPGNILIVPRLSEFR